MREHDVPGLERRLSNPRNLCSWDPGELSLHERQRRRDVHASRRRWGVVLGRLVRRVPGRRRLQRLESVHRGYVQCDDEDVQPHAGGHDDALRERWQYVYEGFVQRRRSVRASGVFWRSV